MKDLKPKAQVYILSTILVGMVILAWNLIHLDRQELWMTLALCVLGSLSLILKVEGSTNRSHYNISFLIYAFTFVLLGPEATILVILISNLAEWAWYRYPWYIPSFNIFSHILVLYGAGLFYQWIKGDSDLVGWVGVASLLATMAFFTLFNHLLIGLVIWLARGENFAKSGIFDFLPLMLDFTLLCMGAAAALIWIFNPFAIILFLLPLYPIYSTLKVPALERKTEIDPKTGLYNVTYFEQALQNELKRAHRFDRPLTVVLADLDLLRNINNTYGHLAGDQVLIGIANILKNSVREYDIVARFGGEEYAILMPETTPQIAYPRIEALRKSIELAEFVVPTSVTPIRATMSFGIAGREGFNQAPNEIIHNADAALYHAKLRGRNGTFIYSEEGFTNLFNQPDSVPAHEDDVMLDLPRPVTTTSPTSDPDGNAPVGEDLREGEKPTAPPRLGKMHPKWLVNVYISATALLGLALFAVFFDPTQVLDWFGLVIFGVLVAITEWLSIDIYDERGTAVSTSTVPLLAGILLFGPLAALFLSVILAGVAWIKYRSPFSRFIFNAANQLIAAMLYTGLKQTIGVDFLTLSHEYQLLLSLGAAGLLYLSTTSLVAVGVSIDTSTFLKEFWREKFSWLAPYYLAMGLIAFALIFSYQTAGLLGTVVVFVPLMLIRISQVQYINRTKLVVQEIREKNTALEKSASEIQRLNESLLNTLAEVVDLRDPHVLGHSKQVAQYAILLAKKLGLHPRQVDLVRKAGLLHDIGKLGISESILFKPDRLTALEYELIKGHSVLGADLLETSHSFKELIPIIRHHHERYDGSGYPDGLGGNDIPMEARILSVADAVEAMASDRPYRRGLTQPEILEELGRFAGTQFDPLVVKAFTQIAHSGEKPMVVNSARKSFTEETPLKAGISAPED